MAKFQVPIIVTVEAEDYDQAESCVQEWMETDLDSRHRRNLEGYFSIVAITGPEEVLYDQDDEETAQRVIYLHNPNQPL